MTLYYHVIIIKMDKVFFEKILTGCRAMFYSSSIKLIRECSAVTGYFLNISIIYVTAWASAASLTGDNPASALAAFRSSSET